MVKSEVILKMSSIVETNLAMLVTLLKVIDNFKDLSSRL